MGFAARAVFQDERKNSAFLKMSEKDLHERIVNSVDLKQHAFDRGRPSKSILFQQKNKQNVVYSNHLFSADFVNTS